MYEKRIGDTFSISNFLNFFGWLLSEIKWLRSIGPEKFISEQNDVITDFNKSVTKDQKNGYMGYSYTKPI